MCRVAVGAVVTRTAFAWRAGSVAGLGRVVLASGVGSRVSLWPVAEMLDPVKVPGWLEAGRNGVAPRRRAVRSRRAARARRRAGAHCRAHRGRPRRDSRQRPCARRTGCWKDRSPGARPRRRDGMRVLRTAGVESESPLRLRGAAPAAASRHRLLERLPDRRRARSGSRSASRTGPRSSRSWSAVATLSVLTDAAEDAAGAVCRRRRALARLRIGRRACCSRLDAGRGPGRDGVRRPRRRDGQPFAPEGCHPCSWRALTRRGPAAARRAPRSGRLPEVADRLIEETGGKPARAAWSCPTGLSHAQLDGDRAAASAAHADRGRRARVPRPVPPPARAGADVDARRGRRRHRRVATVRRAAATLASTRPRGGRRTVRTAGRRRGHGDGAAPVGAVGGVPGGHQLRTAPGAPGPG